MKKVQFGELVVFLFSVSLPTRVEATNCTDEQYLDVSVDPPICQQCTNCKETNLYQLVPCTKTHDAQCSVCEAGSWSSRRSCLPCGACCKASQQVQHACVLALGADNGCEYDTQCGLQPAAGPRVLTSPPEETPRQWLPAFATTLLILVFGVLVIIFISPRNKCKKNAVEHTQTFGTEQTNDQESADGDSESVYADVEYGVIEDGYSPMTTYGISSETNSSPESEAAGESREGAMRSPQRLEDSTEEMNCIDERPVCAPQEKQHQETDEVCQAILENNEIGRIEDPNEVGQNSGTYGEPNADGTSTNGEKNDTGSRSETSSGGSGEDIFGNQEENRVDDSRRNNSNENTDANYVQFDKNASTTLNICGLTIVGHLGAGKSALKDSLVGNPFTDTGSTNGIELTTCTISETQLEADGPVWKEAKDLDRMYERNVSEITLWDMSGEFAFYKSQM